MSSVFSKRDQFCSFWDKFCRFAYLIRLGDHFFAGITFAAVQALPSYNLQRSLLIWKDPSLVRGSLAISAPIKLFRLNSDRFKHLSDTKRSTFNSGAEGFCSGAETASKLQHSQCEQNRGPIWYTFCNAPFHYPVQCEHHISAQTFQTDFNLGQKSIQSYQTVHSNIKGN